jgi:hypothetical protein
MAGLNAVQNATSRSTSTEDYTSKNTTEESSNMPVLGKEFK